MNDTYISDVIVQRVEVIKEHATVHFHGIVSPVADMTEHPQELI